MQAFTVDMVCFDTVLRYLRSGIGSAECLTLSRRKILTAATEDDYIRNLITV